MSNSAMHFSQMDVEKFILSPVERIWVQSKDIVNAVALFEDQTPSEICHNLLEYEKLANQMLQRGDYDDALLQYSIILLLYKENEHKLRRCSLPMSTKALLEKKVAYSATVAHWLRQKHLVNQKICLRRYRNDTARRNIARENKHFLKRNNYHLFVNKAADYKCEVPFDPVRTQNDRTWNSMLDKMKEATMDHKDSLMSCSIQPPIRRVHLPSSTIKTFRSITFKNSFKDIETTGYLAANQVDNGLLVSHLVLTPLKKDCEDCKRAGCSNHLNSFLQENGLIHIGFIYGKTNKQLNLDCFETHELCKIQSTVREAFTIIVSLTNARLVQLTHEGLQTVSKCQEKSCHIHDLDKCLKDPVQLIYTDKHEIKVID